MFSSEVHERCFFELAFYLSAVYGINIIGAPTVFAETEVFDNDGTLTIFQIIERLAENFQPPFVAEHTGWLSTGIGMFERPTTQELQTLADIHEQIAG